MRRTPSAGRRPSSRPRTAHPRRPSHRGRRRSNRCRSPRSHRGAAARRTARGGTPPSAASRGTHAHRRPGGPAATAGAASPLGEKEDRSGATAWSPAVRAHHSPRHRPLDIPLTLTFPPGQRVGGRFSMTAGLRFVRSSSRITTFLISTTLPWSTTSNSRATQGSSPYGASHASHKDPDGGAARPSEAVQHGITESDFGVFGVALLMALDREGGNAGQAHGHLHRPVDLRGHARTPLIGAV